MEFKIVSKEKCKDCKYCLIEKQDHTNGITYKCNIFGCCKECENYLNEKECDNCCIGGNFEQRKVNKKQQGTALTAKHYQQAEVQPIEIMQMYMTKDQFIGFLKGNVIKYTLRARHKDNEVTDITKARQYSLWLQLALQGIKIEPMQHVLEEKQ